jgi:hypothetical protein
MKARVVSSSVVKVIRWTNRPIQFMLNQRTWTTVIALVDALSIGSCLRNQRISVSYLATPSALSLSSIVSLSIWGYFK